MNVFLDLVGPILLSVGIIILAIVGIVHFCLYVDDITSPTVYIPTVILSGVIIWMIINIVTTVIWYNDTKDAIERLDYVAEENYHSWVTSGVGSGDRNHPDSIYYRYCYYGYRNNFIPYSGASNALVVYFPITDSLSEDTLLYFEYTEYYDHNENYPIGFMTGYLRNGNVGKGNAIASVDICRAGENSYIDEASMRSETETLCKDFAKWLICDTLENTCYASGERRLKEDKHVDLRELGVFPNYDHREIQYFLENGPYYLR